jgi:hypothetical protein
MPSFPKEIGSTTEDPRIIGSWARLSKAQTKSDELVALRAFPHSSAAVLDAVVVVPVLVADLRRGAVTGPSCANLSKGSRRGAIGLLIEVRPIGSDR